jgi:hypothetical protein
MAGQDELMPKGRVDEAGAKELPRHLKRIDELGLVLVQYP